MIHYDYCHDQLNDQICLIEQNSYFNSSVLESDSYDYLLSKSIKNTIEKLGSQEPFSFFDINFSDEEKSCLHNLYINHTIQYNNYGNVKNYENEIISFIKSLDNDSETSICTAKIIVKLVNNFIKGSISETAWVAIRAFTETKIFDTARWHIDGKFHSFDSDNMQYKIAITLKGAQTLFCPFPPELRTEYLSIKDQINGSIDQIMLKKYIEDDRKFFAEKLDETNIISAKFGQGAIFIVGSDDAALHSEPPIHEGRLFVSIVPGTKEQIKGLYDNNHNIK